MMRTVYHFILWIHPPAFRHRFRNEMLSIFDEEYASHSGFGLVVDGLMSLARQWLRRTDYWKIPVAISVAFLPTWWVGHLRWGLYSWTGDYAIRSYIQELLVMTLAVICALFIMIMSLTTWIARFQRRRSESHRLHFAVRSVAGYTARKLPGRSAALITSSLWRVSK